MQHNYDYQSAFGEVSPPCLGHLAVPQRGPEDKTDGLSSIMPGEGEGRHELPAAFSLMGIQSAAGSRQRTIILLG